MNWTKEEASFVATGNETRIILGNFYFDSQTTVSVIDPSGLTIAEYFIDDVSVVETAAHVQAGKDTTINEGDTIELGNPTTVGLPCEWYNMSNQIIGRGSTAVITPHSTASYYVRMDLCGNVTYDTIKVSVIPTGIERLTMNEERLTVYPNPATNELSVVGHQFSVKTIEVYDVVGKLQLNPAVIPPYKGGKGDVVIDVSALPTGIYFLKATDINGNVSNAKFVKQ
jgi:hypothetical protein